MSALRPLEHRPDSANGRAEAVRSGIVLGIAFATFFSAIVLVMAVARGSVRYPGGLTTWHVLAFYYGAGIVGGAVFGLLRPWQDRYIGRLASAWVVLYLVYGGATIVFYPMIKPNAASPLPPSGLLIAWAVLCVILAPFYVKLFADD